MKKNVHNLIQGNPVIRACYAALLVASFSLLLVASSVGVTSYAKYLSSASGSDSAHVAAFAVSSGAVNSGDLEIDCTEDAYTASYAFWVKNSDNGAVTEVDVKYTLVVELSEALPNGVTVAVDGVSGSVSGNGKIYTFTNDAWVFAGGTETTATHTLTFTVDADVVTEDVSISNISISVQAEQID